MRFPLFSEIVLFQIGLEIIFSLIFSFNANVGLFHLVNPFRILYPSALQNLIIGHC